MPDPTQPIALSHTFEFVMRHLTGGAERVLEVGCGDGQLAASLMRRGRRVSAVDSDAECVRAARSLGVDARHATWPYGDVGPYDAVLFTRSLHHISPLDAAVDRAKESLSPGGLVLVEDFAFAEADLATAEWLRGALVLLDAAGLLNRGPDDFQSRLLESHDAQESWRSEHADGHEIHPWPAMHKDLLRCFDAVEAGKAPYLYRYIHLRKGAPADLTTRILELEVRMIRHGAITPIGRRFVGRRRRG